jgi:CRP/FNR family transcriptional regulator, cyclic AMP receptor protein
MKGYFPAEEAGIETIEIFKHAESFEEVPAGKVPFKQGDPADVMYAIIEGQFQVEVNERPVSTLGAGEVVGEMAIIDREQKQRSATVRAVTDSRVVAIDEDEFKRLVHRVPFFAKEMLRIVTERLRRANELL